MAGIFDFFSHEDAGAHYDNIYYAEPVKHHASWSHEGLSINQPLPPLKPFPYYYPLSNCGCCRIRCDEGLRVASSRNRPKPVTFAHEGHTFLLLEF
jgi:hypothetical protein